MSRLTDLERRILGYAGIAAADVARALGVGVRRVEHVRQRCGRNTTDGLMPAPAAPPIDYDKLMRANRGIRT